jgi:molecular chaperone Hsp33
MSSAEGASKPDSTSQVSRDTDSVLRALTHDGSFRVITASTTAMVRGAIAAQKVKGELAITFADILTGAVLIRESMAPDLRLQLTLQGDDKRSRIVADTHPDGMTRGLVQLAQGAEDFHMRENGVLQVHRSMHNGALHQGIVGVPENGSISTTLMRYMQDSEQIVTMISIGCHMVNGEIVAAGGYVLQLMPEVERRLLAVMTERLEDFRDIRPLLESGRASPTELMAETLYGMPYEQVSERSVRFGCNCSETRILASLASLPKTEIAELASSKTPLEVGCDFCGVYYSLNPERLRGLIQAN